MAKDEVVRLAAVAVLLFMGLLAWQTGYTGAVNENGNTTAITNETFTSTAAGSLVVLNDSQIDDAVYDEEVDVFDENGSEMTDGDDYEWFDSNGTLKVLGGGDLAGDANGSVSYGYGRPTGTQTLGNDVAMLVFGTLGEGLIWVLGIAFAFAALLILARRS